MVTVLLKKDYALMNMEQLFNEKSIDFIAQKQTYDLIKKFHLSAVTRQLEKHDYSRNLFVTFLILFQSI